jgi:hypothetical protein
MDEATQIRLDRLLWVGLLTIGLSVVAVLSIRVVAVALLKPDPNFQPLSVGTPVFDTAFSSACAVLVFRAKGLYSLEPVREFRGLAWKVLVVSFGPDVALATWHWFGGGWPEAVALMLVALPALDCQDVTVKPGA